MEEKVPVLDTDTHVITNMPIAELAPGMVQVYHKNLDQKVFVDAGEVKPNSIQHKALDAKFRPLMERFSEVFSEVYPLTAEEWDEGFRRDTHPEQEMEIWAAVADTFEQFLPKLYTPRLRKEGFDTLVATTNGPPVTVFARVSLTDLPKNLAKQMIGRLLKTYKGVYKSSKLES